MRIQIKSTIIKLVLMVLNLMVFIFSIKSNVSVTFEVCQGKNWLNPIKFVYPIGDYLSQTAIAAFCSTSITLIFYLSGICHKFNKIVLLQFEVICCSTWVVLYLIGTTLTVKEFIVRETYDVPTLAYLGVMLGYCAMILYLYEAVFKFKEIYSSKVAKM